MANVIWFDGFDHYTNLAQMYNTQYGPGDTYNQITAPAISSSAARNGAGGLLIMDGGLLFKSLPDLAMMAIGFAFRYTIIPPSPGRRMFSFRDEGSENCSFYLSNAQRIVVVGSTGANLATSSRVFDPNTWYYVEFVVVFGPVGAFALNINGATDVAGTGNTAATANNRTNILRIGSALAGDFPFHYDDFYITDGTILGPCQVETPSVSSATYPESSPSAQVGGISLQNWDNITDGGAVHAVATHILASKAYGNTRAMRSAIQPSGSGTFHGTIHYLGVNSVYYNDFYATNPATGGTWTPTTYNSLKAGWNRYI